MSENTKQLNLLCSICLENEFTNVCHSDVCLHEFCFDCLKSWSDKYAKCPLCMKSITTIYYKSSEPGIWATYEVATKKIVMLQEAESCAINRSYIRRNENSSNNFNDENQNVHTIEETHTIIEEIIPVGPPIKGNIRMQVYRQDLWALPFRHTIDCSPEALRSNPMRLYNLRKFVRRDISIISLFDKNAFPHNTLTTINFIVQSVLIYKIEDIMMLFYLFWPYLRSYTLQFCHELYSYASSSYDIIGYDRSVRYYTNDSPYFIYGCQIVPIPYEIPNDIMTITISDSDDDIETNFAGERLNPIEQIGTSYSNQPSISFNAQYSQIKKRIICQLECLSRITDINSADERSNPIEQIGTSYSDQPSTSFDAQFSQTNKTSMLGERKRSMSFISLSSDDEVSPTHDTQAAKKTKK